MAEVTNKANPSHNTSKPANRAFDLQETLDRAEDFYKKNQNVILGALAAVVIIVGGYFAYTNFVSKPKEQKAQAMIFHAQEYFARDSFKLALNGDGNNYGFLEVISKYNGTKMGNLAHYYAGVSYIHLGDYQKGIDQLKSFSSNDDVLQPLAYGMTGDAYMELNKVDDAIAAYKKAGHSSDNALTSPIYLLRAGLALEKAGKNQEAIEVYKEIKDKYPQTNEGREMEKYLARLGEVRE
ncbi:MAG TPA: tetratricopeptide repeat protein [Chitinophaga sp.]